MSREIIIEKQVIEKRTITIPNITGIRSIGGNEELCEYLDLSCNHSCADCILTEANFHIFKDFMNGKATETT